MSDAPEQNRRRFLQTIAAASAAIVTGGALTENSVEAAPPAQKAGAEDKNAQAALVKEMQAVIDTASEEVGKRIPEKFKNNPRVAKYTAGENVTCYLADALGKGHEGEVRGNSPRADIASKLLVVDETVTELVLQRGGDGKIAVGVLTEGAERAQGLRDAEGEYLRLNQPDHLSIVSPGRDEPLKINLKTVTPERLDLLDEAVDVKTAELPKIAKQLTSFAEGSQIFSHGSKTIRVDISPSQLFSMAYVGVAKKVNNADAPAHYIGTNLVVGSDAKGQKGGLIQLLPSRHNEIERYTSPGERTDRASLGQLQFQLGGQDIGAAIKLDGQAVPPSLDDPAKAVTEEQVPSPERKNSLAALQWLINQRWQLEDGKTSKYLKGGLAEAPEGSYTLGAFADGRINTPLLEARAKNEPLKFTGFGQGLAK